jgi:SulP family sulfate permease
MLLLVIYHASRPQVGSLGRVPGAPGAYGEIGRHPDYDRISDVLVLRLEAPLFYANATPVRDRIKTLVGASAPPPKALIIDLGGNERLDITSADMLIELVRTMHSAGVDVALADVRQPLTRMARRSGLATRLGEDRIFHTIDEAVQALGGKSGRVSRRDPDNLEAQ